jgi:GH15 family glucan-1,4-alpha-glucosidase
MTNLDLAAIGNSIIGALIDSRGRISWCCFPRFDGDPVFCSLLSGDEPDSGFFDIEVNGLETTSQSYRANTAIVTTTLTARDGAKVRITDFAPRFKQYERIFRPKMLVRRIEPESGTPHVRVRLRPCFNYGELEPKMTHGSNHIRYTSPDMALRLTTDAPISYVMEERYFNLDGPLTFVLGEDEVIHDSLQTIGREFLEKTEDYWHEWVRYLSIPFEWQEAVIRAAITLKLCSYEDTGAIVAALTTSIPEHANSGRNWDYRFCWLRDAYFVVHALNRLGATRTMEEFIRYIANIAALEPQGRLRPVYGIIPALDLAERVEPALPGYRGMGPVRVGNLAVEQIQNDSYGSAVLAAAQMFFDSRLSRRGDVALFRTLEKLGEQAARFALEPDAGLWEYRTRQRVHTHSVMMCWAACDRLAKIARSLGLVDEAHRWQTEADRLRKAILENAWNETRQSFVSEFGGVDLDASLLLLYEVGFLAPDDPRFISTLAAIEKDLVHNGNLFRYKTKDDFGWPKTAFNVCTFWYIDALAAVGRKEEARAMFERLLAARNHVGLLSEDIDPATGELWGNFPQSYSMVGLIVSAMRLSKTWEEAFWRGS